MGWLVLLCAWVAAGCGSAATSSATRSATSSAARSGTSTAARSGAGSTAPATSTTTSAVGSQTTTTVARARPPRRRHPRGPAPGTLPQTETLPSAHTRTFSGEMAALWRGVRTNSVRAAMPAFFPEAAYAQLKQIGDPQGDWRGRLVADFALDLGAAHQLLAHPAGARLVGTQVPASYAHWVPPGVCDNVDGYYEVPNARVVYRDAAGIHSFGIASMISWRGVWYVVHLGAVLRTSDVGVVDDASTGSGVSAYSSTC